MTVLVQFKYFKNESITATFDLPLSETISERVHHIIAEHGLQPYEEDGKLLFLWVHCTFSNMHT